MSNDLATWLEAIGTSGALAVSLFLLGREQLARKEAAQLAERKQATQVSAWLEWDLPNGQFERGIELWAKVHNTSDEPIFDVHVGELARPSERKGFFFWEVGFVAPRETLRMRVDPKFDPIATHAWPVEVRFADAAGRFWHRNDEGKLAEIANPFGD